MINMSEKLIIETSLDDSKIKIQQAEIEAKNEQISQDIDENEKKSREAWTKTMAAMRSGYMVISGITQLMGGSMSQAFTAMYGIAMSSIQLYMALTPAVGAINPVQATMMMISLMSSVIQLGTIAEGQEEFSRALGGVTSMMQGIGGLLDAMPFG